MAQYSKVLFVEPISYAGKLHLREKLQFHLISCRIHTINMENSSFKIIQRGDVYVMTMLKGENRFNQEFLDHLNEALAFLEQYVVSSGYLCTPHAIMEISYPFLSLATHILTNERVNRCSKCEEQRGLEHWYEGYETTLKAFIFGQYLTLDWLKGTK